MNNGILTLLLLALSATQFSSAVIPYSARYRLGTKECYLIFDLHSDEAGSNLKTVQRDTLLAEGKKKHATFIVEDMFGYKGHDSDIKRALAAIRISLETESALEKPIIIQQSSLFNIEKHCKKHGLKVINPEFRHSSLWYTLLVEQGKIEEAIIPFKKLLRAFRDVTSDMKSYNDNVMLNRYYLETGTKLEKALNYLENLAEKIVLTNNQKLNFFYYYWTCMVLAFDARLIHTWYTTSLSTDQIVVYAGSEHSKALERILRAQGYTKIAEQGSKYSFNKSMALGFKLHKHTITLSDQNKPLLELLVAAIKSMYRSYQCESLTSCGIKTAKKIRFKKLFRNSTKA